MRKIARRAARAGLFYGSYEGAIQEGTISLRMSEDSHNYEAEMGRMYGHGDTPDEAVDDLENYLRGVIRDLRGALPPPRRR